MALALRALLSDSEGPAPIGEVELHLGDQVLTVAAGPEGIDVRLGAATLPVATITGDGSEILAVASGMVPLEEAHDLHLVGDSATAARVLGGSHP